MTAEWHCLYVRSDDSGKVAGDLLGDLLGHGYQRYDPFAGGTGTPPGLKTFVKHFVVPERDGWVRILGAPDLAVLPSLSTHADVLYAHLSAEGGEITAYKDGALNANYLLTYLRPGQNLDDLARARQGARPTTADRPADFLPDDIRQLARDQNVNPEQANKLVNRLTSQLFGKMDRTSGGEASAMQSQARAMINTSSVNWNNGPAQRLKALVSVLTLPANWRDPNFQAVREAYQVARRLAKTPSAQLMPDERAALKAVPDALQYEAVYVGK